MKYAIVTGAYGGMGKKAIESFVNRGFTVFALDIKTENVSPNVIPITADVTSEESLLSAFEKIKSVTDSVFAIVHFAGIYALDSLVEMNSEEFEKIFKINLYGAFNVNKIFLPFLKKGSRIVMVTSELAPLDPLPFTGVYAISKRALDAYAYSLKMELQLLGIFVSVIRAGAVSTDMLGVSTNALNRFCEKTELYKVNSKRFKKIVNSVEAKCIPPKKIAEKALKIVNKRKPKFAYSINRNGLLLLLNALPKFLRFKIIKNILK